MRRKGMLMIVMLLCVLSVSAQQLQDLTLETAVMQRGRALAPKRLAQLHWVPNSSSYYYVDGEVLFTGNAKSSSDKVLCRLDDLKKEFVELNSMKRFPKINWWDSNNFWFEKGDSFYNYSVKDSRLYKVMRIDKSAMDKDYQPAKNLLAYTKANNLFIMKDGDEIAITDDKGPAIVNGKSVHRNEFGIHKGTFWSPESDKLAFYRNDQREVTDYPLLNIDTRPATAMPFKYPMAGMTNESVTIGVYDVNSGEKIYLETGVGEDNEYLTNIAWGPEGEYLYVAVLNRDQNFLKMQQYDAQSGKMISTIFEESSEKYVQPLHPITFVPNRKNEFIWMSERDGYNHIYRYNTSGKLLNQVTQGEWVVTECLGFDLGSKNVYAIATANDGLDRKIIKSTLSNSKSKDLTTKSGTYHAELNKHNNHLLTNFSSLEVPRKQEVQSEKKVVKTLLDAPDPYAGYEIGDIEFHKLKATDSSVLNCRMIKPVDFDENQRYPVLVYVYGGPNVQLVRNTFGGGISPWMQYMAQKGYIVFTLDNRGTANRGRDFEQATFRNLGTIESVDQLTGVEYLASLPYVDTEKLAVHGWSFGGFMTTTLMTKSPSTFKVGVAGGPVIDWKYYEVMYTERYMDTPENNPAGYANSNLIDKAKELEGDLLMIHGLDDDVVVVQHSLLFVKSCVDEGIPLDYFVYPGHKHNVRGKDRVHLMQKVLNYILEKNR
ncbi:prolyl tripeptidyl peptidase [Aureibacter tunicatorum]|nr:prolyl tripeptidyl peptidase [Aureibacter tunicatorum]